MKLGDRVKLIENVPEHELKAGDLMYVVATSESIGVDAVYPHVSLAKEFFDWEELKRVGNAVKFPKYHWVLTSQVRLFKEPSPKFKDWI